MEYEKLTVVTSVPIYAELVQFTLLFYVARQRNFKDFLLTIIVIVLLVKHFLPLRVSCSRSCRGLLKLLITIRNLK